MIVHAVAPPSNMLPPTASGKYTARAVVETASRYNQNLVSRCTTMLTAQKMPRNVRTEKRSRDVAFRFISSTKLNVSVPVEERLCSLVVSLAWTRLVLTGLRRTEQARISCSCMLFPTVSAPALKSAFGPDIRVHWYDAWRPSHSLDLFLRLEPRYGRYCHCSAETPRFQHSTQRNLYIMVSFQFVSGFQRTAVAACRKSANLGATRRV